MGEGSALKRKGPYEKATEISQRALLAPVRRASSLMGRLEFRTSTFIVPTVETLCMFGLFLTPLKGILL